MAWNDPTQTDRQTNKQTDSGHLLDDIPDLQAAILPGYPTLQELQRAYRTCMNKPTDPAHCPPLTSIT